MEHLRKWYEDVDDSDKEDSNDEEDGGGRISLAWSSSLTLFDLNRHGANKDDDEEYEDPIFYGDLRGKVSAESDDGRFTATCWYEDVFESFEADLGSRHPTNTGDDSDEEEVHWEDLTDEEIVEMYAINVGRGSSVEFTHLRDKPVGSTGHFWPCTIVSKHEDEEEEEEEEEDRYVVRIHPSDFHEWYDGEYHETTAKNVLLKNYPRSSIRFVVLPYEGDQYHPRAFRHHIEIRDEIFPEHWKNQRGRGRRENRDATATFET